MQTFAKQKTRSGLPDQSRAGGVINQQVRNILRAGIQPKLKIGAVNDPAEVEADRVADQVMRMPSRTAEQPIISASSISDQARRQCTDCNKDEDVKRKPAPQINMKSAGGHGGGAPASAEASTAINSLGGGAPLPASERAFFEPRFGRDLSGIRIHTGNTADAASQAISARAFSLGNNIAFAKGEYQPGSQSGRSLMAHEITHSLQGGGNVHRKPIEILDAGFVGPPQAHQRVAAASCDVSCDSKNIGKVHVMPLVPHNVGSLAAGMGSAIHFLKGKTPKSGTCAKCTDYKMIQVIETNASLRASGATKYVDNNSSTTTPFYDDVFLSGSGLHTIDSRMPDGGEKISTTKSIYDRPYRPHAYWDTKLPGKDISWKAETCVTCVKAGTDHIMGNCVSYGFKIPWNSASKKRDGAVPINPSCVSGPTKKFISILKGDPNTSSYKFTT